MLRGCMRHISVFYLAYRSNDILNLQLIIVFSKNSVGHKLAPIYQCLAIERKQISSFIGCSILVTEPIRVFKEYYVCIKYFIERDNNRKKNDDGLIEKQEFVLSEPRTRNRYGCCLIKSKSHTPGCFVPVLRSFEWLVTPTDQT